MTVSEEGHHRRHDRRRGDVGADRGGSGLSLAGDFAVVSPDVAESYDMIGFDPRGFGQSDQLGCLDTDGLDELLATDVDRRRLSVPGWHVSRSDVLRHDAP